MAISQLASGRASVLPDGSDRLDSGLGVSVSGTVKSDSCSLGYCTIVGASVPLNSFAKAASVDALNAQMQAVNSQIASFQQSLDRVQEKADLGSAMAASLISMAPQGGFTNRLGMGAATVSGQSAVSLNYSHVRENMDLSAGLAMGASSSKNVAARVGMGFSW